MKASAVAAALAVEAKVQWPQYGGPNRNFTVETSALAEKWPEDGPRKIWHRELGDGYSAIVADGNVLFTMNRSRGTEFTVALDAKTGGTIWEHGLSSH